MARLAGVDEIVARAAMEGVVAPPTVDEIAARAAIEPVAPRAPMNHPGELATPASTQRVNDARAGTRHHPQVPIGVAGSVIGVDIAGVILERDSPLSLMLGLGMSTGTWASPRSRSRRRQWPGQRRATLRPVRAHATCRRPLSPGGSSERAAQWRPSDAVLAIRRASRRAPGRSVRLLLSSYARACQRCREASAGLAGAVVGHAGATEVHA